MCVCVPVHKREEEENVGNKVSYTERRQTWRMWGGESPSEWLEDGQSTEGWGNPSRSQLRMGLCSHSQDAGEDWGQHLAAKGVKISHGGLSLKGVSGLALRSLSTLTVSVLATGYRWDQEGGFPSTTQRERTQNTFWGRESWPGGITQIQSVKLGSESDSCQTHSWLLPSLLNVELFNFQLRFCLPHSKWCI